jgi:CheY-like chemotaxis protein
MKVVAYVTDLMDRSRFGAVEAKVVFVRTAADAVANIEEGDVVVLDLSRPDALDVAHAVRDTRMVGFLAHVETARIQAAKDAGVGEVLPRSRFFSHIVELLDT